MKVYFVLKILPLKIRIYQNSKKSRTKLWSTQQISNNISKVCILLLQKYINFLYCLLEKARHTSQHLEVFNGYQTKHKLSTFPFFWLKILSCKISRKDPVRKIIKSAYITGLTFVILVVQWRLHNRLVTIWSTYKLTLTIIQLVSVLINFFGHV